MCIHVQSLTYIHPDKDVLFRDVNFVINKGEKIALIGNNGSGKSTLMRLIAGQLLPSEGQIICREPVWYVPQHFGQFEEQTVAQALRIDCKLRALHAILQGEVSDHTLTVLGDDWELEERAIAALSAWGLAGISLSQQMHLLSGGEKTRVFLAGIAVHTPSFVLMDEPSNHLDDEGREQLYRFVRSASAALLVVSHDRKLLNLVETTYELTAKGVVYYAGNYDFYRDQKESALQVLQSRLEEKEKELNKARKRAREVMERQEKHNSRGEKLSARKGVARMAMNTLRDRAEKSTTRLGGVHEEKIQALSETAKSLRASLSDIKAMKVDFNSSSLHRGKVLVTAKEINYAYNDTPLWDSPLSFIMKSGDRIHLKGSNGSGKTTLLKLITGALEPTEGALIRVEGLSSVYLDQEYSLVRDDLSVLEQLASFNHTLYDHELKTILNRFLFPASTWNKKCACLSGGEKMKLSLCCLMVNASTPDIFILDEPTNNIDIGSMEILAATLREYRGVLLLVSHDSSFAEQVGIDREIKLVRSSCSS